MIWCVLGVGVIVLVGLLMFDATVVRQEWQDLLYPSGQRLIDKLQAEADIDAAMMEESYRGAWEARSNVDEAVYLLEVAANVLRMAVPSRLTRVRAMFGCARMLSALTPFEPIRPKAYRLRELRTFASALAVIEQFLLTMGQRFRLHLVLIVCGFKILLPVMRRSTRRLRRAPESTVAWMRFESAIKDFRQLDREHLAAVRTVLTSATAVERVPATR